MSTIVRILTVLSLLIMFCTRDSASGLLDSSCLDQFTRS